MRDMFWAFFVIAVLLSSSSYAEIDVYHEITQNNSQPTQDNNNFFVILTLMTTIFVFVANQLNQHFGYRLLILYIFIFLMVISLASLIKNLVYVLLPIVILSGLGLWLLIFVFFSRLPITTILNIMFLSSTNGNYSLHNKTLQLIDNKIKKYSKSVTNYLEIRSKEFGKKYRNEKKSIESLKNELGLFKNIMHDKPPLKNFIESKLESIDEIDGLLRRKFDITTPTTNLEGGDLVE